MLPVSPCIQRHFNAAAWQHPYTCRCIAGPLTQVDAAAFATKAIELGALASMRDNALLSQNSICQDTLLSVVCAVIAAFDFSPLKLPQKELQDIVEILVHVFKGVAQIFDCC